MNMQQKEYDVMTEKSTSGNQMDARMDKILVKTYCVHTVLIKFECSSIHVWLKLLTELNSNQIFAPVGRFWISAYIMVQIVMTFS
jgi:hypothetical protein